MAGIIASARRKKPTPLEPMKAMGDDELAPDPATGIINGARTPEWSKGAAPATTPMRDPEFVVRESPAAPVGEIPMRLESPQGEVAGEAAPLPADNPLDRTGAPVTATSGLPTDPSAITRPATVTGAAGNLPAGTNALARPDTPAGLPGDLPSGAPATPAAPPAPPPVTATPAPGTPAAPPPAPPPATPAAAAPAPASATAWTPTQGIIDEIRGITPQEAAARGYTPEQIAAVQKAIAEGYDATGYDPTQAGEAVGATVEGYTAEQGSIATHDENLSQALDRITGADSGIIQRARTRATQQANSRGLLNSTMAAQAGEAAVLDAALPIAQGDVQAGQFNAAQRNTMSAFNAEQKNAAAQFLASAKNTAAQFLAAEKNQNGRFNAEQANQAKAFSANATNIAAQFLAASKNTAALFNTGEANKAALFAVEQSNLAARFAAEAENAASQFNAAAHNAAMQRYTDALNAALAAQNDAENLARRDTAQIAASKAENDARIAGQIQATTISAGATMGAAGIHAAASTANTQAMIAANRETQIRGINADMERFNLQLGQQESQFVRGLSAQQFSDYQRGIQAGMSLEMEPADRQNWLHNYNSVWAASGTLPFDIDLTKFPPAG